MKAIILLALIGASLCIFEQKDTRLFVTEESLNETKKVSSFETYSYEEHPFKGWTYDEVKGLMGLKAFFPELMSKDVEVGDVSDLPDHFDAREQWKDCVHEIRNQGKCGSCWAFAASEVLSDRFCIASEGKINLILSPEDLVECDYFDHGCSGGNPVLSWTYLRYFGIVTDQCKPYTSDKGKKDSCKLFSHSCRAEGVEYKKYKASALPSILNTVELIKRNLQQYGPVETGFMVYEDFMSYKGGVYEHKTGNLLGGHAVKIVGWGVESGINYWIVANSWGPQWGEGGFFKIKQGDCGFENMGIASTPLLD